MPEYRQEVQDVERRVAVASALYQAFDLLKEELRRALGEEFSNTAAERILLAMKGAVASRPDAPLLAYGKPYPEWCETVDLLSPGSVAKPFMALAEAMGAKDCSEFPTPIDGHPNARVRLHVLRPSDTGGCLAGVVATVALTDGVLTGSFPDKERQAPYRALSGNPFYAMRLKTLTTLLQETPAFVTEVRRLFQTAPDVDRHHILLQPRAPEEPHIGIDIFRAKAPPKPIAVGVALGASFCLLLLLGAYAVMGDNQVLSWGLLPSEGLYTASLSWETYGRAPEDFLVIRRSADGESTEPPSAMPARITGLLPGATYSFRVRRRLFGHVPWSFVTRELHLEVPQASGLTLLLPEPPFGCTEMRTTPSDPRVGQRVEFHASLYGTTTSDVRLSWSIGDAPLGLGGNPVFHTFTKPATYVVGLTVSRPGGASTPCGQLSVVVREAGSPPATPTPRATVAEIALGGVVQALEPLGGTLLLAVHQDAVSVLDIGSSAAEHRVVAAIPLPGARDLALVGRQAYVALGPAGLVQLDLTVPSRPTILSTMPGDFEHVAARGTILVASGASPELRLYALTPNGRPEAGLVIPTLSGRATRLIFVDNSTVVCARAMDAASTGAGLVRLTVPDGSFLQLFVTSSVPDVAATPDLAYLPSPEFGITVVPLTGAHPMYTSLNGALRQFPHVDSLSRVGDRLYIGNDDGSIRTIDVSVPTQPLALGELPARGRVSRVVAVGSRLVLGAEGRIIVVSRP
jgi:hypothetical protein